MGSRVLTSSSKLLALRTRRIQIDLRYTQPPSPGTFSRNVKVRLVRVAASDVVVPTNTRECEILNSYDLAKSPVTLLQSLNHCVSVFTANFNPFCFKI